MSTLSSHDIQTLTDRVEAAQTGAQTITRLTDDFPSMTIPDGYAVQTELRKRFLASGHRLVGWKAGLTSRAKLQQMNVDAPIIGFLTDRMVVPEASPVSCAGLIHPKVECEIAFVLKHALSGPECTAADVLAATDYVLPALEIIDSRYENFRFDLPSVVADNGSSARLVAGGRPRRVDGLDLRHLGVVFEKNGQIEALGAAAAVLDHPAEAVAMLVNVLAGMGESLPAGSFVMSGGITAAIPVAPGDTMVARFQALGTLSVRFTE